jgi:hypothetical protein
MNSQDKKRLSRLQIILDVIPFSANGTATSTGYGAIMFEQDARALRPYVRKITEGMILENNPHFEEGMDYESPDKLLTLVEHWIDMRKREGWNNASEYSLSRFANNQKEVEK